MIATTKPPFVEPVVVTMTIEEARQLWMALDTMTQGGAIYSLFWTLGKILNGALNAEADFTLGTPG